MGNDNPTNLLTNFAVFVLKSRSKVRTTRAAPGLDDNGVFNPDTQFLCSHLNFPIFYKVENDFRYIAKLNIYKYKYR